MIYELREYRMLPGKRDEWIRFMDEVVIPDQTAAGAFIAGSFAGEEDPDLYVWLRRFDSEEHRAEFVKNYYSTERWLNELKPQVRSMISTERVVRVLSPTPASLTQ